MLSYNLTTKIYRNILDPDDDVIHQFSSGLVGYLDDTTWFNSSLHQVTQKLSIANDFYTIANIQINVNKYKLLCNQQKPLPSITLTINDQLVEIPITRPKSAERILEVYVNARNNPTLTIIKCKQIIMSHVITMNKKRSLTNMFITSSTKLFFRN